MNYEVDNMNIIFGLTPFTQSCDAIFMCVWVSCLKQNKFMPIMIYIIVEGMAMFFCYRVYKLHGLPKLILSDMDTICLGMSWMAVVGKLWLIAMHFILKPMDIWNEKIVSSRTCCDIM